MTTRLRLTLGIAIVLAGLIGAHLLAVDGPLTNALNLRVKTDGNGYLLAASGTYSGADGPYTNFGNIRLRTDGNGYLITTYNGTQAFGAVTATDVTIAKAATPGLVVNQSATDGSVIGTSYMQFQTASTTRWFLGMSACTGTGGLEIYNNIVSACAMTISKATGSPVTFTGSVTTGSVAFAALGTPANGTTFYCTDCTETTAASCPVTQASCVCTNGGGGAFARRVAGTWYCTF